MKKSILGLVVLAVLTACSDRGEAPATGEGIPVAGELPEGHPPVQSQGEMGMANGVVGSVLETMNSGGYTYALIQANGDEIWAAGPPTELAVGDSVMLSGAMGMRDFTSSTLNRTFETLLFVTAFSEPGGEVVGGMDQTPAGIAGSGTALEVIPAAGYTYVRLDVDGEEVWLAGPGTEVEEGQEVTWAGGTVMRNFSSSSLERTFDAILFVGELRVVR